MSMKCVETGIEQLTMKHSETTGTDLLSSAHTVSVPMNLSYFHM